MGYFSEHYGDFRYPLESEGEPGFRTAQLGAVHAAAAHFSTKVEPGIITMPTGSGKTAVLTATAFVLRANRVLILTPSRLVREQIAEEVRSLRTLRDTKAIPETLVGPLVYSTQRRVKSDEEWEAMREFDVVVATVPSISPAYDEIPEPPQDLFDLVLVDEAHHSPARTWQHVLDHFQSAKRLLFTATPFRQDQKEIKGRFIFTYDLKDAFNDEIFGEIKYAPVHQSPGETPDIAIALAAQRQLVADRESGYHHHVMVRTDSRIRAGELAQIYQNHTSLRLRVVTGDKSLRYARKVVDDLSSGELDGIICVNMLGEGFNYPSLKIAAIHSPHKSLGVTLQFIGRFARTTGRDLGPATFLAIPSEIEIEAERLYDARSVWKDVIQNLSETRVHQEATTREVLDSFTLTDIFSEELNDLSLYVLEPYYHVKIYQMNGPINIQDDVIFPAQLQVAYKTVSEAHNAAIYITREISLPRWSSDDRLSSVQPDLFIFWQDPDTNLLFICASRRTDGLYEQLAASFETQNPKPLSVARLNRVLNDLQAPEFFNVGMRNRVSASTTESYRIIAGSNADKAILKSDGRLYHRGHVFGRGIDNGDQVTIGLSSASKVWSNKSSRLPDLITWCKNIALRLARNTIVASGSGLDYLDVGEEIDSLPPGIVLVDWPLSVYKNPPLVRIVDETNVSREAQLLDFDLTVETSRTTSGRVRFSMLHSTGVSFSATFSFETDRFIEPASATEPELIVVRDRENIPIVDFLNAELPQFYTAELAMVHGYSMLPPARDVHVVLDADVIETVDWHASGVDIRCEFGDAGDDKSSIHEFLKTWMAGLGADVIYYDHGTGEIADFVVFMRVDEKLVVSLFHCKAATGRRAGRRLSDVYEISSQAIKSVTWALKQRMLNNIRRRFNQRIGSHEFIVGDLDALTRLLSDVTPAQIEYECVAVQPGIKRAALTPEMANVLGAANDHLIRGGFRPLRIIGSE